VDGDDPLTGDVPAKAQVQRAQYFSKAILQRVGRDKPVTVQVPVDAAQLKSARRAWLRLVVEDISPGEATVALGDQVLPLPRAMTADNNNAIVEVPLPLEKLSANNSLEFRVEKGNFDGWRLDMASIVLESGAR